MLKFDISCNSNVKRITIDVPEMFNYNILLNKLIIVFKKCYICLLSVITLNTIDITSYKFIENLKTLLK